MAHSTLLLGYTGIGHAKLIPSIDQNGGGYRKPKPFAYFPLNYTTPNQSSTVCAR